MQNKSPQSARDLITQLGRPAVAEKLGVNEETVRVTLANKARGGLLPSHWFFALSDMGEAAGVNVSTDLFHKRQGASA